MSKKYWFGKEIEGRLYGLESAFISDDLSRQEIETVKRVHHFLLNEELINKLNDNKTEFLSWDMIFNWIVLENKFVTLNIKPYQLKSLPMMIRIRCHLLLNLDVPELVDLKSTDSVKISSSSHEMYITSLINCQQVTKNDYYHDRYEK